MDTVTSACFLILFLKGLKEVAAMQRIKDDEVHSKSARTHEKNVSVGGTSPSSLSAGHGALELQPVGSAASDSAPKKQVSLLSSFFSRNASSPRRYMYRPKPKE